MTRATVYIHVSLIGMLYRTAHPRPCMKKTCIDAALFVQATLGPGYDGPNGYVYYGYITRRSAYCAAHFEPVNRRRGLRVVHTVEELRAIDAELKATRDQEYEAARRAEEARRARLFAEEGRILVQSGFKGSLWELPNGTYDCVIREDGTERHVTPCCPRYAAHLIDHRIRGHAHARHDDNCPKKDVAQEKS